MKRGKALALTLGGLAILGCVYLGLLIPRGFSARDEPSSLERVLARAARNLSIPSRAAKEANPWNPTPDNLKEAREIFTDRCTTCHGHDGRGRTDVGRNMYPKPPDLTLPRTQNLTDGQIHYIIQNGVRLTGMPAWDNRHNTQADTSWKLVLLIRDLRQSTPDERQQQEATAQSAHYTGSQACQKCHEEIYAHWKKTPMANVVRDPREHPEAILPNLSTNSLQKFTKEQVALVYGSLWKQCYFTKMGDDYYPEPAQWDVTGKFGGPISWRMARIGGRHFILLTISSVPPAPLAMAAIPSTTTFAPNKSWSGTLGASAATALEANTSRILRVRIF